MVSIPFQKQASADDAALKGEILSSKEDIFRSNHALCPFVYFSPEQKHFLLSSVSLGGEDIDYKGHAFYQLDRDEFMSRKTSISLSAAKEYEVIELDSKGQEIRKDFYSSFFSDISGSKERHNPARSGAMNLGDGVTLYAPWVEVAVRDAAYEKRREERRDNFSGFGFGFGFGRSSNGKSYDPFNP